MYFSRRVPHALHDEHLATLLVLEKLEGLLRRHAHGRPPAGEAIELMAFLATFVATVRREMTAHFRFEEDKLFPLLAARGEADIGALLAEEHATILPISERMCVLASGAREDGFVVEAWSEFRRLGEELIERLVSHIQKEEMALLPLLDDMLEDEDDARLAERHALSR